MNEIKGIVSGNEVDVSKVATIVNGVDKGWEVRRQNGDILWAADRTLIGTDTIQMKGYGLPLKSVHIKGNTQQTGTPSPQSTIVPDFCGVRTGNLFDKDNTTIYNLFPGTENTIRVSSNARSIAIHCVGGETYTVSKKVGKRFMVCFTTEPIATQVTYTNLTTNNTAGSITVIAPLEARYMFVYFYNSTEDTDTVETIVNSIMINTGSAALPYEPYGWAEKITCAAQTTPIYLGQVQTVRRIGKYIVTGDESFVRTTPSGINRFSFDAYTTANYLLGLCSHYKYEFAADDYVCCHKSSGTECFINDNRFTTQRDFADYAKQQYAAGTPITFWYVLAEPETGIVNEPLAKIGDYADELHIGSEVTIPTAVGTNILTVDTSLAPSRTEITGHVK